MSLFGFFKRRKEKKEASAVESLPPEEIEEGIEAVIQKKQREIKDITNSEELVLEDYEPKIPIEETVEELKEAFVLAQSREEGLQLLQDSCEQILEAQRQGDNAKIEYQAVTEYLSDVQKIERMEESERALLTDAAKRVITLAKERKDYESKEVHTTDSCFRAIRNYEGSLQEELKKMRESEKYNQLLKNDMRQLEAEKAALKYERHDLFGKQAELKKLAIATVAIVLSLFVLFIVLGEGLKRSMSIPYIMTVAMAAVIAGYIFWESYRNRYEHAVIGKKINRAIELLNKVKIKYINNTNALEYNYSKLSVQNSMELEYLIKEYTKAKEQERTYQSNVERLGHYREKIVDILQLHEINDAEIWLHQISALVQDEEFSAIKKNLEDRRKKLTERMDYNLQVKDNCFDKIHQLLAEQPDMKEDVLNMFEKYHIEV